MWQVKNGRKHQNVQFSVGYKLISFQPISTGKCFMEMLLHYLFISIVKKNIFQKGGNFKNCDVFIK
jgi:hypothetical protein